MSVKCYMVCPNCGAVDELVEGEELNEWVFTEISIRSKNYLIGFNGEEIVLEEEKSLHDEPDVGVSLKHEVCGEDFEAYPEDLMVCVEDGRIVKMGDVLKENRKIVMKILRENGILKGEGN